MIDYYLDTLLLFICNCPMYDYFMNYLIHAAPVHPSLCLQYFLILMSTSIITDVFILLLLLFHYCYCHKTVATDKLCRASLLPGAAELTNHLSRLINILWLPLCRINKFGFYFPRRLLRSPILVGHQDYFLVSLPLCYCYCCCVTVIMALILLLLSHHPCY